MAIDVKNDPGFRVRSETQSYTWYANEEEQFICTDIIDGNFGLELDEAREVVTLLQNWLKQFERKKVGEPMKANICSEYGNYSIQLTGEELQVIYQALKDSLELLEIRTPADLPEPYVSVGKVWVQRRKNAISALHRCLNHSRGIYVDKEEGDG